MSETARGKLTGIEVSRGIAASAVVFYHVARHLDKNYGVPSLVGVLQFGHAGVDLFFVISGFIILYVHYRDIGNSARIGHYLNRRLTRVFPTYWVALAVTVALDAASRRGLPSYAELTWDMSLLPANGDMILGIAWTLRYEIVFYACFIVLILNRTIGIALFMLWMASVIISALSGFHTRWLPESLYSAYNLEFFFGMAVAYAIRNYAIPAPRLIFLGGTFLFAAAAVAEDCRWLNGYADISRIVYGLPAALIVLGVAAPDRGASVTIPRFLRALGAASYSIYLFQFIFIGVIWKMWLTAGLDRLTAHTASFPLLALGGVAGGVLVSRLVEYPLIGLVRGNNRRIRTHTVI